jgi:hypothetical protein
MWPHNASSVENKDISKSEQVSVAAPTREITLRAD